MYKGRIAWGSGLAVAWSENHDELYGFSLTSGKWATLKIEPQDEIRPSLGTDVAAVQIGNRIAAFSAVTTTWDAVDAGAALPAVAQGYATFRNGDHIYTFAASLGKWTSPTDPKLQPKIRRPAPCCRKTHGDEMQWE